MADNLSKAVRSMNMSRIKSRDTLPELKLIALLKGQGLKFSTHDQHLPGKPDILFKKEKLAIFVDGCFWHKCPVCYVRPKSNNDYWDKKIERNVLRDRKQTSKLRRSGWSVLRIREHRLKRNAGMVVLSIKRKLIRLSQ